MPIVIQRLSAQHVSFFGRLERKLRPRVEPCYSAILGLWQNGAYSNREGMVYQSGGRGPDGTGIAGVINRYGQGVPMTKEKWLLLGALIVGLLVVLYFVFLCPSDCH